MNPAVAATAGSRLISTPKTPAGIRRSASSSSVYGIADDIIPTAMPTASTAGDQQVRAALGDPDRRQRDGRHQHRERQPGPTREGLPDAHAEQDVGGPEGAGQQGERHAEPVQVGAAEVRQQQDAGRGERHPGEVERPARAEHRNTERADELEGDGDAERDPVERRVEGEVHPREREPEQHRQHQLAPAEPAQRRPPDQGEHDRGREHAQEDRAAGADLVEQPFANAEPNWTEATAPRTSTVGGTRSAGDTRPDTAGHATRGAIIRPVTATEVLAAPARERSYEELERIFAGVDAPFALVDLDAMWSNAREMLARAAGTPIRVASKSVRCRPLLRTMLDHDRGFRGLMTFTLPESLWLHGHGFDDLLLAYPTAHAAALAELARLESERPPIVMVDSAEQLDYIEAAAGPGGRAIRVCLEFDTGWWPLGGRVKVGVKRSPVRTPEQARALAREVAGRARFELAALMGYEAHIAGVGDRPLGKRLQGHAIRFMKRRSASELAERRAAVVAAVREVAPVPIVNGGGTGSIHTTGREPVVTEITAGSGFFASTLFDRYSDFSLTPGGDVRHAGGAPPERRRGHPAGRRLPRLGRRRR